MGTARWAGIAAWHAEAETNSKVGGVRLLGSRSTQHQSGDKYGHSMVDWEMPCKASLYLGQHQCTQCLPAQGMLMVPVGLCLLAPAHAGRSQLL